MARLIITAQVEDGAAWAKNFQTHKKLFKEYTATRVRYGVAGNQVATLWTVDDADKMLKLIDDPKTAEAMASDGVVRDTVQILVLDQKIDL